MNCITTDIIDIVGLCDSTSLNLDANPYWTQLSIPENLLVPEEKPEIEQINSVNISVEIIRQKVVVTPKGRNIEGKIETGRKLIIEGNLCQAISYTGAVLEQSVHTAHFIVPFSAFIIIPLKIRETDTLHINFQINPCIEDVFVKSFCGCEIFKNVTLLLQAVPTPSFGCPNEC
jgi:hypothetical protein